MSSSSNQNHKIAGNVLTLSTAKQSQQQQQQSVQPKKNPPPSQLQYPPRYQPPPQPPGGILKHISNPGALSQHLKRPPASYYHSDLPVSQASGHLGFPKLAGVYLPEKNASRIVPPRVQLRLSGGAGPTAAQQRVISGPPPPPPPPSVAPADDEAPFSGRLSAGNPQPTQEMLKFVRKPDSEQPSPTSSAGGGGRISTAEHNRHLQSLIAELRTLKEVNQRLSDDNQELRDLCCFLDDDRQKSRKLSREWHRFGRYTASVMRQEVSAYQNKLRQLDDKQQELIRDNLELKDLCLYLDEERANAAAARVCSNCGATMEPVVRDDGDGSSSSTNADEPMQTIRNFERSIPELNLRPTITDQTLQYVRSLERRIRQLEDENTNRTTPTPQAPTTVPQQTSSSNSGAADPISGRPEAVVRALQVLEVREQLERDHRHRGLISLSGGDSASPSVQLDEGEKALVREMCNVMWRNGGNKLDDTSSNEPEMDC